MKRPTRAQLIVGLVFLAVLLLCPFKTTTAPRWRIQVVDESGKPVPHTQVTEKWEYFDIEVAPWVETRSTDEQGRTEFPRRTIWASLARRVGTPGPAAEVQACDDIHHLQGQAYWENGSKEMNSKVVAKAVQECSID